ncbi:hypothetical protein ACHAWT_000694 [Skeletonema menzelii]|eukprot:scaffold12427_cov154-Skeletonema_menzelii.AAC.1
MTNTAKRINLSSSANSAKILFATDEWFASAENILSPYPPTFIADLYCEQGKVMDGWETRRKRTEGHDWCVVKLGCGDDSSGPMMMIESVQLDTMYFTGNQTPRISIEAMKITRSKRDCNTDNDDYLYNWMPGAISRLARGKSFQGTGQSPATIRRAHAACQAVALNTTNQQSDAWITILPMVELQPGYEETRYHKFQLDEDVKQKLQEIGGVTHIRLNYYPDGGVARLKIWGYPVHSSSTSTLTNNSQEISSRQNNVGIAAIHPHSSTSSTNPPPSSKRYHQPELSSVIHGGEGLACSNKHYGVPSNLIRPTLGVDMGDGWETARHPQRPAVVTKDPVTGLQDTPLMDWAVLKLGMGGVVEQTGGDDSTGGVERIIIDTRHFKGNFPESVSIDACCCSNLSDDEVCASASADKSSSSAVEWFPLLKRTALSADAEHEFLRDNKMIVNGSRGITHVRVSIFPDGGLSRVRIYGQPLERKDSNENRLISHL